ncbi:hypothetical protein C8R46DRAFT_1085816 [Mycena filopes]|nr:hypothetical protein C8R46DRAFT_1085816 [Mycena filopes]
MAPVLLSRALDAGLGILTGIGAYYLHEIHPRTNILPEARLQELIKWKWQKYRAQPPASTL